MRECSRVLASGKSSWRNTLETEGHSRYPGHYTLGHPLSTRKYKYPKSENVKVDENLKLSRSSDGGQSRQKHGDWHIEMSKKNTNKLIFLQ